jgi:hypothetical protein
MVCKSAFLNDFGITKKRCERLKIVKVHGICDEKMLVEMHWVVKLLLIDIHCYLESYPVKLSHYTGK